jgi:hypothetical protein
MLHALMKAVAHVNEGSMNIDDARIKRLISATLRGGNGSDLLERRKKKQNNAAPGTPGAPPVQSSPLGLAAMNRSGGGETVTKPLPMIDPDDIFGADSDAPGARIGGAPGIGGKKESAVEASIANSYVAQDPKWRARG